jgi:hypothetical protein
MTCHSGPALQGRRILRCAIAHRGMMVNYYFQSAIRRVSPSNSMLQNAPPW